MSEKADDGWTYGRFKNLAQNLPPVEVDCSGWEPDIPADQWTVGTFVNLAQTLPPVDVDCSDWDRLPAAWVEVRGAGAGAVVAAALALKLVHDPARSRADTVAFTAADPAATREELAALIPAIRAAVGPGADIRLCPAA